MPKNARAQLYVTELPQGGPIGVVGKYDATTGAAISPSFITGLNFPVGLAVKGNTLFVANFDAGTVGKYDATTGGAINASFITGLNGPVGLAVKGNTLFVANLFGNTVGKYDATT
jgi:DNA-binding beta-propeller fold protein YncE